MKSPTFLAIGLLLAVQGAYSYVPILEHRDNAASTPEPEPIEITELPLPPVTPSNEDGSCTSEINSRGTGCMGRSPTLQNGNFLPDGDHVLAILNFTGAPAAPDPANIYQGMQLIAVRTNGTTFPNGDAWKCITCGVPTENMVGSTSLNAYPQAFHDGKRALVGTNIVDCGSALFASPDCTPEKVHIYPIRWNVQADGSGSGGNIRELRIHPDNVHLGFNSFTLSGHFMGEFSYFGRLLFNPSPSTGTPLTARYDLVNVTLLYNSTQNVVSTDGDQLIFNPSALRVGEFRGFTGRGNEVTYLGQPVESCNFDVFAADLTTGAVRRITSDPGYTDPLDVSYDDKWQVILTTLPSERMLFLSALRGVPPITDLITSASTASVRNNGQRRFFQPWLLDHDGDRGTYIGQQINAAGDGSAGSINDPNWNSGADPRWSPDGTSIVYFQNLVIPPACGGQNPLPCPNSTAPGGRASRLMLARLTSRQPVPVEPIAPVSDEVPWGIPYVPGSTLPDALPLIEGNYTLKGNASGSAYASFTLDSAKSYMLSIAVTYSNYSDDGINLLSGTESVTATPVNLTLARLDWYSDLTSIGESNGTKVTSPDGFHLEIDQNYNYFNATGTLMTTVDGVVYKQPLNDA